MLTSMDLVRDGVSEAAWLHWYQSARKGGGHGQDALHMGGQLCGVMAGWGWHECIGLGVGPRDWPEWVGGGAWIPLAPAGAEGW